MLSLLNSSELFIDHTLRTRMPETHGAARLSSGRRPFPVVWQELGDRGYGMAGDAGQDVLEP